MKTFTEYKNLFKTFPDLGKHFYHVVHYMKMMNESNTGCYFTYNMDMLLYNIAAFKRYLKSSTKKVDNVLYYPFSNDSFPELRTKPTFLDFKDNALITEELEKFNPEKLFRGINNNFTKLKTQKLTKDQIIEILQSVENSLLFLIKAYQIYIKQYEQSFKK